MKTSRLLNYYCWEAEHSCYVDQTAALISVAVKRSAVLLAHPQIK